MLTLQHFLLRGHVLALYRSAVRASRSIPDLNTRQETLQWIRGEFERNRHVEDLEKIKTLLRVGRRDIKELLPSITLANPGRLNQ
ncbi:hypothetical protein BOTBODRAFT_114311 [Botryobasidium botryosum FD-172 SS1]|uniref:LYR motif-containing protein 2 n=1 Tax=Botryobasidium botryosum (strain FD-172 SS1) TaxID=930990 RepID=A0A067M7M6_BOTB1|nr:hypothetical protein BOTBODRAFT_114311 [Botryobasidium botryosum FD-172 SS1]